MFGQHLAALDAAVFAHLADDTAALWSRGSDFGVNLAAMLDRVERPGVAAGMAFVDMADVVRVSAAQVEEKRPGQSPQSGDIFIVGEVTVVVHGTPWRDEAQGGRDWLCLVSS